MDMHTVSRPGFNPGEILILEVKWCFCVEMFNPAVVKKAYHFPYGKSTKTNSKKNSVDVYPIFPIDDFNEEFMFNKIKYSKFSISLVYKLRKKEENNS